MQDPENWTHGMPDSSDVSVPKLRKLDGKVGLKGKIYTSYKR